MMNNNNSSNNLDNCRANSDDTSSRPTTATAATTEIATSDDCTTKFEGSNCQTKKVEEQQDHVSTSSSMTVDTLTNSSHNFDYNNTDPNAMLQYHMKDIEKRRKLPVKVTRTATKSSNKSKNTNNNGSRMSAATASSSTLQGLPSYWEVKYDPKTGRPFYIDHQNKITTWTAPTTVTAAVLPSHWEVKYDTKTGRSFYIDHQRKITTWTPPPSVSLSLLKQEQQTEQQEEEEEEQQQQQDHQQQRQQDQKHGTHPYKQHQAGVDENQSFSSYSQDSTLLKEEKKSDKLFRNTTNSCAKENNEKSNNDDEARCMDDDDGNSNVVAEMKRNHQLCTDEGCNNNINCISNRAKGTNDDLNGVCNKEEKLERKPPQVESLHSFLGDDDYDSDYDDDENDDDDDTEEAGENGNCCDPSQIKNKQYAPDITNKEDNDERNVVVDEEEKCDGYKTKFTWLYDLWALVQRFRSICGLMVNASVTQNLIVLLIMLNAIMLGISTFAYVRLDEGRTQTFQNFDEVCLTIFTVELCMQFVYHGWRLFTDGWLLFDTFIIVFSWSFSKLSIVRAFRIVRALRLITRIECMKNLISALINVIPRMSAIFLLLILVMYIFAVMFTQLWKPLYVQNLTDEDYFGGLGRTFFTLFQLMTMDSWAHICRQLMIVQPLAWLPITSYVILTAFVILNLIIAVLCDAIATLSADEKALLMAGHVKDEEKAADADNDENNSEGSTLGDGQPMVIHSEEDHIRLELFSLKSDFDRLTKIQAEILLQMNLLVRDITTYQADDETGTCGEMIAEHFNDDEEAKPLSNGIHVRFQFDAVAQKSTGDNERNMANICTKEDSKSKYDYLTRDSNCTKGEIKGYHNLYNNNDNNNKAEEDIDDDDDDHVCHKEDDELGQARTQVKIPCSFAGDDDFNIDGDDNDNEESEEGKENNESGDPNPRKCSHVQNTTNNKEEEADAFDDDEEEYDRYKTKLPWHHDVWAFVQGLRLYCGFIVNASVTQNIIIVLIAVNAIMLGIGTYPFVRLDEERNQQFERMDEVCLIIFTVELCMQFVYHGWRLFTDGWLIFDTVIIITSWSLVGVAFVRAFRIIRALRVITRVKSMKNLILALISVVPRMFAILLLLSLVSYIFAVMFTQLWKPLYSQGVTDFDFFGGLFKTFFTLFQIMTMDAWSDLCRQVMSVHSYAWIPITIYVVITAFVVVNLMIAVLCDAISALHDDEKAMLMGGHTIPHEAADDDDDDRKQSCAAAAAAAGEKVAAEGCAIENAEIHIQLDKLESDMDQVTKVHNVVLQQMNLLVKQITGIHSMIEQGLEMD